MGIFDAFTKKKKQNADFSNVRSGGSSTAPAPASPAPGSGTSTVRVYEVKKGDSLSKIARHFYGKADLWPKIYEANRSSIENPDLIYPGQELKIPDLEPDSTAGRR